MSAVRAAIGPPRRLRYRFMSAYARGMVAVIKIGAGAALGVAAVVVIWIGATIIRHM
jgi:hypothetical protein